jgi:hypothetical protein
MTDSRLSQLEAAVNQLSLPEQLWLVERMVQRIRERSLCSPSLDDGELARMAGDPAVQQELKEIETEFALADPDGLDDR